MKITRAQLKKLIKEELDVVKTDKPVKTDQSKNGVKVMVTKFPDGGTIVESDCQCFGIEGRVHSNQFCPLLRKSLRE